MRRARPQLSGSPWEALRGGGTLADVPLLPPPPPLSGSAPSRASDDEQLAVRTAARQAEDAGDLIGACRLLALLAESPEVLDWKASLEAGLRCRNDAERARWLLQPAFRHGCAAARRHVLAALAADVLRTRGIAAVTGEAASAACALRDPLLVDAGLFDLGMLADYVVRVLEPGRHPLRTVLQGWVGRPATVWEVRSVSGQRLDLQDLVDGAEIAATAATAATGAETRTEPAAGDLLYGRLVPLGRGHGFTFPPVPIDRLPARRVLRAIVRAAPLAERLRAVASYQRRVLAAGSP